MKNQKRTAGSRLLAIALVILVVSITTVLPTLALDIGGMNGMRHGARMNGRTGATTDAPPIGEGIESAVDNVTDGIDSVIDRVTESPNGSETNGAATTETDGGMMGDESLENGTNIPDSDIGGAVDDNDNDGVSDPTDSDDDNDGVLDSADTDANGDGQADNTKTAGIIGIVVAVIIVLAIIILVIAVMPRGRNKK